MSDKLPCEGVVVHLIKVKDDTYLYQCSYVPDHLLNSDRRAFKKLYSYREEDSDCILGIFSCSSPDIMVDINSGITVYVWGSYIDNHHRVRSVVLTHDDANRIIKCLNASGATVNKTPMSYNLLQEIRKR